ncbi:MAG: hypothetical protein IT567_00940 [Alphaproteobacteria bacterium]|nr:hypothetical protein [Alphaproteobacteria bacterium]
MHPLEQRIEQLKSFRPTVECPAPSFCGGSQLDDLLAVAAGTKPAAYVAVLSEYEGYSPEEIQSVLMQHGLRIMPFKEDGRRRGAEHMVFVYREPWQLAEIQEIRKLDRNKPEYHQRMGDLMGYPQEAISLHIRTHPVASIRNAWER